MYFVYVLRSVPFPNQLYIGYTEDLETRLKSHNYGGTTATARYKPWHLEVHVTFNNQKKAIEFEKYLKSGSGKAILLNRLL